MNIFVARLNFKTDSDELRAAFETFGEVDSAKVIMDHFTGKSRGFGFVEMPNDDEAQAAIDALNDSDLDGNNIVVKKAEPRNKRGGGNRDRRGGGGYNRRDSGGGGYNRRDSGGDRYNRRDNGGDRYNRRDDNFNYNRDRY